ncbi:MAG TPA: SPOR domain-containing protein, partial [Desulfomonilia bacterium]|nr:SPOR domain-containing protein [Desulfomonilia bacterium]
VLSAALLMPMDKNLMDMSRHVPGITKRSLTPRGSPEALIHSNDKTSKGVALAGLQKISIQDQSGEAEAVPPDMGDQKKTMGVTVVVGPGDTVAKLAARHYGRVDFAILDIVRKANRKLGNIDLIYEGQKIYLPPMTDVSRILFTVSVASYHSINEATAVFLDLVKKGFQATIYPHLDSKGNVWYRVTIGTFPDQDKADEYTNRLKAEGFLYAKAVRVSMEG